MAGSAQESSMQTAISVTGALVILVALLALMDLAGAVTGFVVLCGIGLLMQYGRK